MSIDAWWPRVSSTTRAWVMAHNGSPVPPEVAGEVERAGGPPASDPWWSRDEVSCAISMPDAAVDRIEEYANDEDQQPDASSGTRRT